MKLRFPTLTLLLSVLVIGLALTPGAAPALQFDRTALATGELWRGLTAHFVHFNSSHLVWDLLMLIVLGALTEQLSRRGLALTLAASALTISASVWIIQPSLATYRGLSGVDCALFGYVLASFLQRARQRGDRPLELVTIASGLFVLAKTVFEFATGQTLFADTHDVFVPVPLAHLVGLLSGVTSQLFTRSDYSTITPFHETDEAII